MNLSGFLVGIPAFNVHGTLGHDDATHARFNYLPGPRWQLRDWEYLRLTAEGLELLEKLMEVYGSYLEENFYELKRSSHWRLYSWL